jgi:hypothetical protein
MVAAQIFNEQEGNNIPAVYGGITTGVLWNFIKLTGNKVCVDLKDYSILDNPRKIIGIFSSMMRQEI